MRRAKVQTVTGLIASIRQAASDQALLALLNLPKGDALPVFLLYERSIRPQNFSQEAHLRVANLMKLARATVLSLSQKAAFNSGMGMEEALSRERQLRPLNEAFAQCRLVPFFALEVERGQTVIVSDTVSSPTLNPLESLAMIAIRDLVRNGEIEKLRECENDECRRWFLATRSKHLSCSQACRQRKFQNSDE